MYYVFLKLYILGLVIGFFICFFKPLSLQTREIQNLQAVGYSANDVRLLALAAAKQHGIRLRYSADVRFPTRFRRPLVAQRWLRRHDFNITVWNSCGR